MDLDPDPWLYLDQDQYSEGRVEVNPSPSKIWKKGVKKCWELDLIPFNKNLTLNPPPPPPDYAHALIYILIIGVCNIIYILPLPLFFFKA